MKRISDTEFYERVLARMVFRGETAFIREYGFNASNWPNGVLLGADALWWEWGGRPTKWQRVKVEQD